MGFFVLDIRPSPSFFLYTVSTRWSSDLSLFLYHLVVCGSGSGSGNGRGGSGSGMVGKFFFWIFQY